MAAGLRAGAVFLLLSLLRERGDEGERGKQKAENGVLSSLSFFLPAGRVGLVGGAAGASTAPELLVKEEERRGEKRGEREEVQRDRAKRRRRRGSSILFSYSQRERQKNRTPYRLLRACSFSLASSLGSSGPCERAWRDRVFLE